MLQTILLILLSALSAKSGPRLIGFWSKPQSPTSILDELDWCYCTTFPYVLKTSYFPFTSLPTYLYIVGKVKMGRCQTTKRFIELGRVVRLKRYRVLSIYWKSFSRSVKIATYYYNSLGFNCTIHILSLLKLKLFPAVNLFVFFAPCFLPSGVRNKNFF